MNYEKFNHKVIWGGAFSLVVSVAAAFVLSACSESKEDRLVRLATKALKAEYPNAELVSFEVAQKEYGLKSKECFIRDRFGGKLTEFYSFAKVDNEIYVYKFNITTEKGSVDILNSIPLAKSKNHIDIEHCFK